MSEFDEVLRPEGDEAFEPTQPEAELKKAAKSLRTKDIPKVIKIAEAFVEELPNEPYGYMLLGIVSEICDERSQAINMFFKAHELDPDCRELTETLSNFHFLSGNMTDGVYFAKLAETLDANQLFFDVIPYEFRMYRDAFKNMQISHHYIEAMRAYSARQYNSCVDECVRELRQNNHHKLASELLGYALLKTGRVGRAVSAFQTAIHLAPDRAKSTAGLGEALLMLGHSTDAMACFNRALDLDSDDPFILAQCQRGLARIPGVSPADLKRPVEAWLAKIEDDLPSRDARFDSKKGGKIRVGIMSDMFYSSKMRPYFSSLFDHYDRSQVEVRLYSFCQIKDGATAHLRNSTETWREIHDIDQFTLAETLLRENLDIIVDLCFEAEEQAIELFTARGAKNQVSWFGLFEAASLLGMTHVLSDTSTEPVDQIYKSDAQVCVLPANGLLTREIFVEFDEVLPSPVAETNIVMFGMRADPAAITPTDALMISDLLRAVPGSRLMLGLVEYLDDETQKRLLDVFSIGGIIDRVIFQELTGNHGNEKNWQDVCLCFFQNVDVFLSPAAAIEFDDAALSLWMGAPVVAMQGNTRAERLISSVLTQAQCDNWIAQSRQEFVEIGQTLAADVKGLADMRLTLRDDVLKTNLFSGAKVAKEIWKSLKSICEG